MLGCVQLSVVLWTVACHVPLPMEFFKQEYWSGVPFPTSGHLPESGIEPMSLGSPAFAGRFFTIRATWEAHKGYSHCKKQIEGFLWWSSA